MRTLPCMLVTAGRGVPVEPLMAGGALVGCPPVGVTLHAVVLEYPYPFRDPVTLLDPLVTILTGEVPFPDMDLVRENKILGKPIRRGPLEPSFRKKNRYLPLRRLLLVDPLMANLARFLLRHPRAFRSRHVAVTGLALHAFFLHVHPMGEGERPLPDPQPIPQSAPGRRDNEQEDEHPPCASRRDEPFQKDHLPSKFSV
jgi:hypothetical protein